jgi:hypothetical protein
MSIESEGTIETTPPSPAVAALKKTELDRHASVDLDESKFSLVGTLPNNFYRWDFGTRAPGDHTVSTCTLGKQPPTTTHHLPIGTPSDFLLSGTTAIPGNSIILRLRGGGGDNDRSDNGLPTDSVLANILEWKKLKHTVQVNDGKLWFAAKILSVNDETRRCEIQFDWGDKKNDVSFSEIQAVPLSSKRASRNRGTVTPSPDGLHTTAATGSQRPSPNSDTQKQLFARSPSQEGDTPMSQQDQEGAPMEAITALLSLGRRSHAAKGESAPKVPNQSKMITPKASTSKASAQDNFSAARSKSSATKRKSPSTGSSAGLSNKKQRKQTQSKSKTSSSAQSSSASKGKQTNATTSSSALSSSTNKKPKSLPTRSSARIATKPSRGFCLVPKTRQFTPHEVEMPHWIPTFFQYSEEQKLLEVPANGQCGDYTLRLDAILLGYEDSDVRKEMLEMITTTDDGLGTFLTRYSSAEHLDDNVLEDDLDEIKSILDDKTKFLDTRILELYLSLSHQVYDAVVLYSEGSNNDDPAGRTVTVISKPSLAGKTGKRFVWGKYSFQNQAWDDGLSTEEWKERLDSSQKSILTLRRCYTDKNHEHFQLIVPSNRLQDEHDEHDEDVHDPIFPTWEIEELVLEERDEESGNNTNGAASTNKAGFPKEFDAWFPGVYTKVYKIFQSDEAAKVVMQAILITLRDDVCVTLEQDERLKALTPDPESVTDCIGVDDHVAQGEQPRRKGVFLGNGYSSVYLLYVVGILVEMIQNYSTRHQDVFVDNAREILREACESLRHGAIHGLNILLHKLYATFMGADNVDPSTIRTRWAMKACHACLLTSCIVHTRLANRKIDEKDKYYHHSIRKARTPTRLHDFCQEWRASIGRVVRTRQPKDNKEAVVIVRQQMSAGKFPTTPFPTEDMLPQVTVPVDILETVKRIVKEIFLPPFEYFIGWSHVNKDFLDSRVGQQCPQCGSLMSLGCSSQQCLVFTQSQGKVALRENNRDNWPQEWQDKSADELEKYLQKRQVTRWTQSQEKELFQLIWDAKPPNLDVGEYVEMEGRSAKAVTYHFQEFYRKGNREALQLKRKIEGEWYKDSRRKKSSFTAEMDNELIGLYFQHKPTTLEQIEKYLSGSLADFTGSQCMSRINYLAKKGNRRAKKAIKKVKVWRTIQEESE